MKRTGLILLTILSIASCSHTRDLDIPEAAQDAVGFDVYTRSTVSTKAGFTGDIDEASFKVAGFGVYAYVGTAPDFMRNQHVTYSGGSWVYSPLKYWPNQDTDKISFYAYGPHVSSAPYTTAEAAITNANNEEGILYIPGTDATGDPVIVYKTAADPSNNVDLMFGVAAEDHASPDVTAGLPFLSMTKLMLGEKMKFNFKHALTKLVVNVDGYFDDVNSGSAGNHEVDANTRIVVESVSISTDRLATYGTLNLKNTEVNTPKWELGTTPTTLSAYPLPVASNLLYIGGNESGVVHFSQQPLGVTKTKQSLMGYGIDGTTAASLMFVPNGAGTGNLDVTIVYHVITRDARLETGYNDVTNTITKNIATLGANAFQPGYLTTLNLHLGLASVKFDATVTEWGNGGTTHANLPSQLSLSVGTECFYFWGAGHNAPQTFTANCSDTDVSASVVWSSDNEAVATVSANGLMVTSGSSYGVANITGTYTKDWGGFTEIATVSYPVYVNLVSGISSMTATKTQIVKDEVTTVNAVIEYNGGMGTFGTPPLPVTFEFDDTGLTDNSSAYLTLGSVSHPSPNTVTANVTGKAYGGEGRVIKAVIPAAYTTGGGDLDLSTKVNCAPLGTTGYLFKVNDSGKKVYFARSNLFYTADSEADKKWRLMEHPWSTIESNGGVPTNYGYGNSTVDDVDASLFAWATSGWSGAGSQYMPYSTSNNFPSPYGTNSSLTGDAANADWGVYNTTGGRHIYLFDGNTHLDDGSWRTPTGGDYPYGEWAYLVSLSTRRGWATIDIDNDGQENDPDDIYGFVFLPENWNTPSGLSAFDCSYDYEYNPYWNKNVYTREEWDLMEKAGAAFLPAAGYREGTGVYSVRVTGEYWSSTTSVSGAAKYFRFNSNSYAESRNSGRSIRLIRDVE